MLLYKWGFPRWCSGKEFTFRCRRHKRLRFDPWVGKITWSRKGQLSSVVLPGKFHGQRSLEGYCPWGLRESDMTELLNIHSHIHRHTQTYTHIHTHTQAV